MQVREYPLVVLGSNERWAGAYPIDRPDIARPSCPIQSDVLVASDVEMQSLEESRSR